MAKTDDWPKGIDRVGEQCPICKERFEVRRNDVPGTTMEEAKKALKLRIGTHHCKTREDFSQTAARIVREATKD